MAMRLIITQWPLSDRADGGAGLNRTGKSPQKTLAGGSACPTKMLILRCGAGAPPANGVQKDDQSPFRLRTHGGAGRVTVLGKMLEVRRVSTSTRLGREILQPVSVDRKSVV